MNNSKRGFVQISKEAEEQILSYPWPGNIRELRNTVERIVLLEKGDTILGKHLSFLAGREEPPEETGSGQTCHSTPRDHLG